MISVRLTVINIYTMNETKHTFRKVKKMERNLIQKLYFKALASSLKIMRSRAIVELVVLVC